MDHPQMIELATWITVGAGVYALIGVVFALAFVVIGAGRIDPLARSGSFGFRLAIFPGAAALWPLLLARWMRGGPPVERNAHRDAAAPEVRP